MIRFAIALMVGGALLTFFGYREFKLSSSASSEAQSISGTDIFANGYGDNAHVNITDLYILDSFAYEGPADNPSKYNKVWIPAIAMDDPWVAELDELIAQAEERNPNNPDYSAAMNKPYPTDIKLVIYSEDLNNDSEVGSFIEGTDVKGMVINDIEDLSGDELKNLQGAYPGLSPDNVLILEHNRTPTGTGLVMLMLGGGIVLFLAGPGLFFLGARNG